MSRELDTLKHLEKEFRSKNSTEAAKVIFGILGGIKQKKGLKIQEVNQFLYELVCLKRETIDDVIHQIKYRQGQFKDKHINYLKQTIQNIAKEPKRIYTVSNKLKVNI